MTRHGESGTHFYNKWNNMRNRVAYDMYYRGILIDPRWDNYLEFKKDMYESYLRHLSIYGRDKTTLDRKDNSLGYNKSNCRWATPYEQNMNRKCSRLHQVGSKQ